MSIVTGFIREHIGKQIDVWTGNRSKKWPEVRNAHLKKHPTCAACGRKKKLEVHHVVPFQVDPSLELEESNLITLCSHATECHLSIGHLGSFHSYNSTVREDSAAFLAKVENRPKVPRRKRH